MTVEVSTVDFLSHLRSAGVIVRLEGGRLHVSAPKDALTPELREQLAARKPEILAFLKESLRLTRPEDQTAIPDITPAKRTPRNKGLSFGQQRLWYLDQFEPHATAYNISLGIRMEGRLDREALEKALREIVHRHESLRTAIVTVDGSPETRLMPSEDWRVSCFDLRYRPDAETADAAHLTLSGILDSELRKPFDLTAGNLIRATLVQTSDLENTLLLIVHHIAVDGWSLDLLSRELAELYTAFHNRSVPAFSESHLQYSDYSAWQAEWLDSGVLAAELPYWKQRLQGATLVELPSDHPRPAIPTYRGRRLTHLLSSEVVAEIRDMARVEGVTVYMALLSGFYLLLNRYTRQTDLTVGASVAGRVRPEFENIIGLFINSLAFRTSLEGNPTVRELLERVKETTLDGLAHQHVPFDRLVAALQPPRELNRAPFFELMFNLQKRSKAALDLPELKVEVIDLEQGTSRFDLTVEASEIADSIRLEFEYSTDLYDEATIRRFVTHFERLLAGMAHDRHRRISDLEMFSGSETSSLLSLGQGKTLEYRRDRSVAEWIEGQCAATPRATAILCEGRRTSYGDLSARSNRLARHLKELGVSRGSLVGVSLDRSEEMIVAVLAIWKAGAAYVPLDPTYPAERLAFMAEDAAIALLITEERVRNAVALGSTVRVLTIDKDRDITLGKSSSAVPMEATGEDLAYVIYTSGSTGKPKGVQICHRALANFLTSMLQEPGMTPDDCLLSVTTLSFDIAGLEIYLPLVAGARTVIATREAASDGPQLAELIASSGATVMQATPATWRLLLEAGWEGSAGLKIICGGEAFPQDLASRLLAAGAGLWNAYGPTETTIWSTLQKVTSPDRARSIGRPIANTQIVLLDEYGQLVPKGAIGELCIGGDGLAHGYLNRAELTQERFIRHPRLPSERLYRTGDLARWLPDETIEFLGRIDQQVKIRGFRVELEEIEAALESNPRISQAVVVVRDFGYGDQRLVAYLVVRGSDECDMVEVRRRLLAVLPEYMVPAHVVTIPSIPLTPNGKVDRRALAAREVRSGQQAEEFAAPNTHVERLMAEIWRDVLHVETIGLFDNFFTLGGHSLSATRLIARMRSAFQVDLPLRCIFLEPTIGGLSKHIHYDASAQSFRYTSEIPRWKCLVPAQPRGTRPPFFCVTGYQGPDDTLLVLSRLIPHLGVDQPVFGFRPRWIEGDGEPYTSVEEAAREFLAELRTVQPKGPYLLGGHCVGGVIALEIARQLMADGEKVAMLALFDTERPTAWRTFLTGLYFTRQRWIHILDVMAEILSSRGKSRREILRNLFHRKFGKVHSQQAEQQATDRFYKLKVDYRRLTYSHRATEYEGRITLFVNARRYAYDKNMGWTGVPKEGLEVHSVPGDHDTALKLYGKEFAEALIQCIDAAIPAPRRLVDRSEVGVS